MMRELGRAHALGAATEYRSLPTASSSTARTSPSEGVRSLGMQVLAVHTGCARRGSRGAGALVLEFARSIREARALEVE